MLRGERFIEVLDNTLQKVSKGRLGLEFVGLGEDDWGIGTAYKVSREQYIEGRRRGLRGYARLAVKDSPRESR